MHGEVELVEKLGRNDPCPCESGRPFQAVLHEVRPIRRVPTQLLPEALSQLS
ncbi:MAG: SEC-C metal-binding domain-containing protein [Acidimicrobiales bacterium]